MIHHSIIDTWIGSSHETRQTLSPRRLSYSDEADSVLAAFVLLAKNRASGRECPEGKESALHLDRCSIPFCIYTHQSDHDEYVERSGILDV